MNHCTNTSSYFKAAKINSFILMMNKMSVVHTRAGGSEQ